MTGRSGGAGAATNSAANSPWRWAERPGVVQPGEENAPETLEQPPVPKGTHEKAGEGLGTSAHHDKTRVMNLN